MYTKFVVIDVYQNVKNTDIIINVAYKNNKFSIKIKNNIDQFRNIIRNVYENKFDAFVGLDCNTTVRVYDNYFQLYDNGAGYCFEFEELLSI